ncbi:Ig-like domain repeat protein [Nocardioides sp. GXQ0305]|uniref:Ig-like domain repeat protein n=1 Tax=Nocardioides sp. GXQ0305 TaxID=3423912 RepID=UPI003D7F099F
MSRRVVLALCALLLPLSGLAVSGPAQAATPTPSGLTTSSSQPDEIPVLSWDRVPEATSYNVQVSTSSSFSSLAWSATTVNLNVVPTEQLPNGDLWFRVRAVAPGGTSDWATYEFERQQGIGPTPQSPANEAVLRQPDDPVMLQWTPTPGATEYVVEISSDAGFTEPTLIKRYETQTTTLVRYDQQAARPYYWRVAGVLDSGITTRWSAVRSYTLAALDRAQLVSPPDGASLSPVDDVVLDWQPVPGAASYDVEISLVPDFSTTVHTRTNVLGTRYSPPTTLDNNQYYWRVRARDVFGNLQGGEAVSRWTFRRAWSEQPTLEYPVDGVWANDPFYYQWSPVKLASRYQLTVKGTGLPASGRTCITTQTTYTPSSRSDCMPVAAGTYTWQVIALDDPAVPAVQTDPVNAQTGTFSYVPRMPQPLAPASGSEVSVPTLRWEPVNLAAEYDVVITNTGTGSVVVDTTTRATSYTPTAKLENGTYRWFVRTVTEDGRVGATPAAGSQRSFRVVDPPAATASTPEPTTSPGTYGRFPALAWTPVPGATHYKVLIRRPGEPSQTTLTPDFAYPAATDTSDRFLSPGDYLWRVDAYQDGLRLSGSQNEGRFTIAPQPAVTGQRLAMSGDDTGEPSTSCALTEPDACRGIGQTPVFRWDPEPETAYYEFYLSYDRELTNLVGKNDRFSIKYPVDVHGTSYTPNAALPEADAGTAFYWGVRPCTAQDVCRDLEYANHSFNKVSQPVEPLSPGIPLEGPEGRELPQLADDITFTWEDYLATNAAASGAGSSLDTASRSEARSYRIQVASDPQFNDLLDNVVVDQTTFTSYANTYPDTQLYWRVQAIDGSSNALPWSPRWTFDKQSPVPELVGPSGTSNFDGSTPLRWRPLAYAAAYEVQIYRNGDTKPDEANLVDEGVFAQTAVSWLDPVEPAAQPYTWRVRRVDGDGWRGDWSSWMSYRVTGEPVQLHSPAAGTRQTPTTSLFSWAPVRGAATYRWERRAVGSSTVTSATTPATAYAPTTTIPDGNWEWRVVALDNAGQTLGSSEWRAFDVVGLPQAQTATRIEGSGQVGTFLTSTDPSWDLDGVTNHYQWLRNGSIISGATSPTYELTGGDLNRAISLRVTGRLPGYRDATSVSNAITAVAGAAPTTSSPPRIEGSGHVGDVLTATPPQWNQTDVTMTHQWMRDGVAIGGQTGPNYTVTSGDVGKNISYRTTGRKTGYADAVVFSNVITGVAGPAATNQVRPSISGTPKVGWLLSVDKGSWTPSSGAGFSYAYQWLRDGTPIPGAVSGSGYRVQAADAGREVSVQVTAKWTGHTDGVETSDAVAVPRVKSTTTGQLSASKIRKKARAKVSVYVSASGLSDPTGKVRVKKGSKTLASATLKATRSGRITVTLPRLPKGRHQLKVSYAGETRVAPSTSKAMKLTVTR